MTIQEALNSGKQFKRRDWVVLYSLRDVDIGLIDFTREDILAFDWEIEEEKIELTAKQICEAIDKSLSQLWKPELGNHYVVYNVIQKDRLLKELGFTVPFNTNGDNYE